MSRYVNLSAHAIDVPGGAVVAAAAFVELDDAAAETLVRAGVLQAAPDPEAPAPKSKSSRKASST